MKLLTSALAAALLGIVLGAFGASQDGAFANDGLCTVHASPGNAQQSINNAGPGSVICLAAGNYQRLFIYRKSDILVTGAGQRNTMVFDGTQDHTCILVIESHSVFIHGMTASACHVQAAFAGDSTDIVFSSVETAGGPIGFQYRNSTGKIVGSWAHHHSNSAGAGFGAIVQQGSNVRIENSKFGSNAGFGILAQHNTTLNVVNSRVLSNRDGGIFTLHRTGNTTITGSTIAGNKIGVFAGEPGCAPLPAADPNPPQCYLQNPGAYYSQVNLTLKNSTVRTASKTGVVVFPGVHATLRLNRIEYNNLTGLFAWGARVSAAGDVFNRNRENGVECRAYPGPSTGDRGSCVLTYEHIHHSRPLPNNVLGGGFVSEGANFRLVRSLIERNWGMGVSLQHRSTGELRNNLVRYNGGSWLCIRNPGPIQQSGNRAYGNGGGLCRPHP